MSLNKNKSEIVESFKNLLKKADEVQGIEANNENNSNSKSYDINLVKLRTTIDDELLKVDERLGIKSIKRIPSNPFTKKNKRTNSDELEKFENELISKIDSILNRHLYHWLNRELPKYCKVRLRKYIYEILSQLIK